MSRVNTLKHICFLSISSLFITGCFGNSSTPFIVEGDVLEPLRESRASWPDTNSGWIFKRGSNDDSPGWCDANGFIEASVDEVWQALRDADVVVERARVDEWEKVGSCDAEPFEECFDFFTHMSVMGVDIDTIVTWRYDVQKWAGDKPIEMVVRYQKSWGSDVIDRNTGSLILTAVNDTTTRVEYVGEIETWGSEDSDAMESYARSLVADLEAFVEGRPLP
jgi:hypothetical protein